MAILKSSQSANVGHLVTFVELLAGGFGVCVRRARQLVCGITGHEMLLHFRPGRLCLRCALCGHESRGWDIGRRMAVTPAAGVGPVKRPIPLDRSVVRRAA